MICQANFFIWMLTLLCSLAMAETHRPEEKMARATEKNLKVVSQSAIKSPGVRIYLNDSRAKTPEKVRELTESQWRLLGWRYIQLLRTIEEFELKCRGTTKRELNRAEKLYLSYLEQFQGALDRSVQTEQQPFSLKIDANLLQTLAGGLEEIHPLLNGRFSVNEELIEVSAEITELLTGSEATFPDARYSPPLKSLVAELESGKPFCQAEEPAVALRNPTIRTLPPDGFRWEGTREKIPAVSVGQSLSFSIPVTDKEEIRPELISASDRFSIPYSTKHDPNLKRMFVTMKPSRDAINGRYALDLESIIDNGLMVTMSAVGSLVVRGGLNGDEPEPKIFADRIVYEVDGKLVTDKLVYVKKSSSAVSLTFPISAKDTLPLKSIYVEQPGLSSMAQLDIEKGQGRVELSAAQQNEGKVLPQSLTVFFTGGTRSIPLKNPPVFVYEKVQNDSETPDDSGEPVVSWERATFSKPLSPSNEVTLRPKEKTEWKVPAMPATGKGGLIGSISLINSSGYQVRLQANYDEKEKVFKIPIAAEDFPVLGKYRLSAVDFSNSARIRWRGTEPRLTIRRRLSDQIPEP